MWLVWLVWDPKRRPYIANICYRVITPSQGITPSQLACPQCKAASCVHNLLFLDLSMHAICDTFTSKWTEHRRPQCAAAAVGWQLLVHMSHLYRPPINSTAATAVLQRRQLRLTVCMGSRSFITAV